MNTKFLMTVREAADALGISPQEVYRLAAGGEFDKRYVGRKASRNFNLTVESVEAWAKSRPSEPVDAA